MLTSLIKSVYRKYKKPIKITFAIGFIIVSIHIIHALTLDRIVVFTQIDFESSNLPPRMNGYRVAFITDPHYINFRSLENVIDRLNQENIDLLLLGGDFARHHNTMEKSIEIIATTNTTHGIFGVEGNHDNHDLLRYVKESNGIGFLSNQGLHIKDGFFVGGVRDPWRGFANIESAIEGSYSDDFIILISHQPDVVMEQSTVGIDLILSGHLHGGQITFFGFAAPALWSPVLTNYGQRFMKGFSTSADGIPIYTSRGLGHRPSSHFTRIFARPEVVIFTLYSS